MDDRPDNSGFLVVGLVLLALLAVGLVAAAGAYVVHKQRVRVQQQMQIQHATWQAEEAASRERARSEEAMGETKADTKE